MFDFFRDALAVYRLSSLLVREAGPLDMFERLRDFAGIAYNVEDKRRYSDNVVGKMLLCMWCTSIWAALAMLLLPVWVKNVLALSAAAIVAYLNEGDIVMILKDFFDQVLKLCEHLLKRCFL